jgi:hypothetical protein
MTVVSEIHVKGVVALVPSMKTAETSAAEAPKNKPERVRVVAPDGGTTGGTTATRFGARNGVVMVVPVETGLCPSDVLNRSVYVYTVFSDTAASTIERCVVGGPIGKRPSRRIS